MEFVEVTIDHAVGLVRLNRPPVNALSESVAAELSAAFAGLRDPAVRAVVVTGQPHFAAGGDIKSFVRSHEADTEDPVAWKLQLAISALEDLAKPTIAAVHGFALGGGLEIALGCDFRYLAEDAEVGQPEILLGLIPGAGGTQRLPRIVGFQKAKEMIFSGRRVGADEAMQIGLADRVAPADSLLELALEDARKWATRATLGIAAAKRALHRGAALPVGQGVVVEQEAFKEIFPTEDAREGVLAFVEKRPARFKGV